MPDDVIHQIGRWRCPNCGEEVWGSYKKCTACSHDCTGEYYLPEGEPPVTEADILAQVLAGPNWRCDFCEGVNSQDHIFCGNCGGQRTEEEFGTKTYADEEVPRTAEEAEKLLVQSDYKVLDDSEIVDRELNPELYQDPEPVSDYSPPQADYDSGLTYEQPNVPFLQRLIGMLGSINLKWIGGLVLLVLVGAGLWFLFKPITVEARIDHFEWSRTVHIDEYRTVREDGWSAPSGARNISTTRKIHHYDRVFDGYETKTRQVPHTRRVQCGSETTNNGNGSFSTRPKYCNETYYTTEQYQEAKYRQEPVYQNWYEYDIDKWVHSRNVETGAHNRDNPHWGEVQLECANQTQIGCERENSREEHYIVVFSWKDGDKNKTIKYEDSQADWNAYDERGVYTVKYNRAGMVLNDPLHAE